MAAIVEKTAMGFVTVVTIDREGNECVYTFAPHPEKPGIKKPTPDDDGRKYTPVVLEALWEEGIPVEWDEEDLSPSERAQLDAFCNECGTAIRSRQVDINEWEYECEECGLVTEDGDPLSREVA